MTSGAWADIAPATPARHVDENYAHHDPRSREDITALLADATGGFVAEIGGSLADIGQVWVCGGLSDLRTMSTALMGRLDVEVEPLDSLFGIDAHLPGKLWQPTLGADGR